MSRKFTDNEVRAFSKNRNEEKILKERLIKLREQFGLYHDLTSKHRIGLLEECKEIRRTTGGSIDKVDFDEDEFDISKRVVRPWAYSVMDSTYNATYKDASIPLPKKKNRQERAKSETMGRKLSTNRSSLARSWTTASRDDIMKGSQKQASDSLSSILPVPGAYPRSRSQPEIRLNHTNDTGNKVTEESEMTMPKSSVDSIERSKSVAKLSDHSTVDNETLQSAPPTNDGHSLTSSPRSTNEGESLSISFRKLSEVNPNTRIIVLPPAYKIDSKAYQQAERDRAVMRSRSSKINVPASTTKSNIDGHASKLNESDQNNLPNVQSVRKNNNSEFDDVDGANHEIKSTGATEHEVIQTKGEIMFKGRTLKNYIRPEERYKLDPIVLKRRQNRMDKLAKESVCFLKKVNHENIRVEIAFPRAARKRLLTKLVQEHNECKSNKHCNKEAPVLQRKVQDFMVAISDYIDHQHLEAEQFHNV